MPCDTSSCNTLCKGSVCQVSHYTTYKDNSSSTDNLILEDHLTDHITDLTDQRRSLNQTTMPSPEHNNLSSFGIFDLDKIVIKKNSGPITRAELTDHNGDVSSSNLRHELWTVDTKYVYHGYALYCYLRPLIVEIIHENGNEIQSNHNEYDAEKESQNELLVENCDKIRNEFIENQILAKRQNLAKRQKQVLRRIEAKQLYNHILYHISIFHLPKNDIESAKDYAMIADLCEDSLKIKKDDDDLENLKPYITMINKMLMKDAEFEKQLKTITRIEFIEHNHKVNQNWEEQKIWTTYDKYVYDARKLSNCVLPLLKRYDKSAFNSHLITSKHPNGLHKGSYANIFHFINTFHIPWSDIERVKRRTIVGKLLDDKDEMDKLNQEHIKILVEELEESKTVIIHDLYECALRFENSLNDNRDSHSWYGHLTQKPFPVGRNVDLESFRQWPDYIWEGKDDTRHWVDDVGSYEPPEEADSLFPGDDEPDGSVSSHVPWRDDWEPFSVEIDGDVAWDEMPKDVIKNDESTESQFIIWRKRERHPERCTVEWMAKRRAVLFGYDLGTDETSPPYAHWADRMRTEWDTFQELCENWHPGYIEPRPQYQPPPPEEPWQVFANPNAISARQVSMLSYFAKHKFVKDFDVELYRDWSKRTKEGWEKFLIVCDNWSPDDIPFRYNKLNKI